MPVNNALTPEGQNALGAAFGYYPQLRRNRTVQDPRLAAEMPLQFLRGRLAGTLGLPSDVANLVRSPMPMEMYGDVDYSPQTQVPYGSQELLRTLPFPPQGPAQSAAANVGAVIPLTPMEALQAARAARQAALAGGRTLGPTAARMTEGYLQRQGLMPGVLPDEAPKFNANQLAQSVKPRAEVSPLGFYSAVEQQALNIPRKQGTGESFLNDLAKGQDVKKYEMETMGLDAFLRGRTNVTRQEVQDFIASNRINVQERQLGAAVSEDPIGIAKRKEIFDQYEPQIQAMYKEMDSPSYKLVNRQVSPEEKQRGIVLQNRVYRNEPLTAHEQAELTSITDRFGGVAVKEFANVDEARKFYLGMSQEERLRHSIMPVNNPTQLQEKINTLQNVRDAQADAAYVVPERVPSKYHKFQLPGGENYREILLTLPEKMPKTLPEGYSLQSMANGNFTLVNPDNIGTRIYAKSKDAAMEEAIRRFTIKEEPYRSSHFNEPNILAHMRVNDRIDADGKKMLLIEEVQSDWHQAGRERGYQGKGTLKELPDNYFVQEIKTIDGDTMYVVRDNNNPGVILNKDYNKQSAINGVINELNATSAGGVPDAPFKDTWHQLALKRALKEAVDKGYDRIGLTTGKQQAERYDLSKQISKVYYSPPDSKQANKYGTVFKAFDSRGNEIINKSVTPEELPGIVGKEVAQKLLNADSNSMGVKALEGVDLQVGGEGMKKYYDEIYPAFLEKQGKKYGAKVGETRIKTGRGVPGGEPVRYLDITPEMRKAIKEGQPIASITNHLANAMA
jgi:hypothetical protein